MATHSTQDSILDSASTLFGRLGYRGASMDRVAQTAGVAKGTLYLYCANKEDLFYQAVHRELRSWVGKLSRKIDPRLPADQLMLRIAEADRDYFEKQPLARDLMFGLLHGELPDWRERFEELRQLGRRPVMEILELGIRQGVFASDLDVEATAAILQDLQFAAVVLQQRTESEKASVRRHQLAAVRLVMRGLLLR